MTKIARRCFAIVGFMVLLGLCIPERAAIPVAGASRSDWNPQTFWFEPWGASGVHKGIDIFASADTTVVSAVPGLVIFRGQLSQGGNVLLVLGPKWRVHYYAHLNSSSVDPFDWVSRLERIGTVGDTGNAIGKPPHLHYSIVTLLPYVWQATGETQGWKKIFYLDPGEYLLAQGGLNVY